MLLLRLIKNNRTGGIVFVILVALLTYLVSFIIPSEPIQWVSMPFYNLIFGQLYNHSAISNIIALIFHLLIALILIRLNIRFSLIGERTFMPAFFYLIIVNAFPALHPINPMLVGSLFYLLGFTLIFGTYDAPPDTYKIFNASIMLFIGVLFYAKLVWFLPLIWLVLLTIRAVSWRELVYPVVALLLIGLLMFIWYWVVKDSPEQFVLLLRENLEFGGQMKKVHLSNYLFIGYLFLLVFIASAFIIMRFQARKIIIRNIYQSLLYLFLFSFIFYFFISRYQQGTIYYTAIPLAILLSNFFHQKRNLFIKELLIWVLIGLVAFVQFSG